MKFDGLEKFAMLSEQNANIPINDPSNLLSPPIMFNKKSFTNKVLLSLEMATYWDLSIGLIRDSFYNVICRDHVFISELDLLTSNNQYDIALLKFLHFLNPSISHTLKKIIIDDEKSSNDDILVTKGKLKYRGGELIPPSIYSNESYTIDALPKEGGKVYTQNKTVILISDYLGDGGEGIVYKTSRKNEVVKLIKPDNKSNIKVNVQKRLEQMVQMKITNPNIIWPIDTVYNEKGQFVGFTMKLIAGIDLKRFTSSIVKNVNDNSDEVNINDIDKKSLCKIILSILDTITYLHDKNIVIGDIKLENFMIKDNDITNIYFIDCDSYQIGNYPSLLVSPGFIPPEIDPINLGKQNTRYRTFGNENFAIFSLIFHLVFRAKPPYSQQIHDDAYVAESVRVTKGLFPYFLDKDKTLKHAPKGMEEPIWAHLPSYIKKAFINCANRNGENFGEANRMTPHQWKNLFTCYLQELNGPNLVKRDPLCNQYHYGLHDSIDYGYLDYPMPTDVLYKISSMEDTIIQRFRNNDYIKNMIITQMINFQDFNYIMFNNKLYNNKVLLSLELVKNWKMGLDFLREEQLGTFGLSPTEFSKITSNKAKRQYDLALFNFIKALNKGIFLAYDGLFFNNLDEYGKYLNDYYFFPEKSMIPFEIIEEAVHDEQLIYSLKDVYSNKSIKDSNLDIVINLLSDNMICADGHKFESLDKYVSSIYEDELNIKTENLLTDKNLCNIILRKNNIDINKYDFSRKESYHDLMMNLAGYVPFKYQQYTFTSLEDIVNYSKLDIAFEEKFNNIGRWINNGTLKRYTSFYPIKYKVGVQFDVFKMVSDYKLDNRDAGFLFYLVNNPKPLYVTRTNVRIGSLKELMEILSELSDVDSFTEMLYSSVLFELWCELHKK